jgi:hypothetical protein
MTRLISELEQQIAVLEQEAATLHGVDKARVQNQIKARKRIVEERLYHGAKPTSRPKQFKPHPAWRYSGRHR